MRMPHACLPASRPFSFGSAVPNYGDEIARTTAAATGGVKVKLNSACPSRVNSRLTRELRSSFTQHLPDIPLRKDSKKTFSFATFVKHALNISFTRI